MTFKEKLQMEHPDNVNDKYMGGCFLCPHTYGYETRGESLEHCVEACTACWNREMPEERKKEIMDDGGIAVHISGQDVEKVQSVTIYFKEAE